MATSSHERFISFLGMCADRFTDLDLSLQAKGFNGEGLSGTYGTHVMGAYVKLIANLMEHGELPRRPSDWQGDRDPILVDFGGGIGRMMVFWQAMNVVARAFGIEFDSQKVKTSEEYMVRLMEMASLEAGLPTRMDPPEMIEGDLEKLDPALVHAWRPTLGFTFWVGIPRAAQKRIGHIFLTSQTMEVLVVVDKGQRWQSVVRTLTGRDKGSDAPLPYLAEPYIARVVKRMRSMGSGEVCTAFIIKKRDLRVPKGNR